MERERIHEILSHYNPKEVKIGVLGSHSALEMGHGAKQEGFEVVVVCQKGREKTYTKHYRNLFDHVLLLDKFVDIIKEENQAKLRQLNTIFVPNRSFSVYTGYDNIEQKFNVPLLGNRFMLRSEERNIPRNQYDLIRQAGLNLPKILGRFSPARTIRSYWLLGTFLSSLLSMNLFPRSGTMNFCSMLS